MHSKDAAEGNFRKIIPKDEGVDIRTGRESRRLLNTAERYGESYVGYAMFD